VIIPFSNDQFAWAHRSYDLGVGSKPIYGKDLTADKLAVAIEFAHSNNIVKNSKTLGQNIATENGASDCAQVVLSCLEREKTNNDHKYKQRGRNAQSILFFR